MKCVGKRAMGESALVVCLRFASISRCDIEKWDQDLGS